LRVFNSLFQYFENGLDEVIRKQKNQDQKVVVNLNIQVKLLKVIFTQTGRKNQNKIRKKKKIIIQYMVMKIPV